MAIVFGELILIGIMIIWEKMMMDLITDGDPYLQSRNPCLYGDPKRVPIYVYNRPNSHPAEAVYLEDGTKVDTKGPGELVWAENYPDFPRW